MDNLLDNKEDYELKKLLQDLESDDGIKREKAREALVRKSRIALDFLTELLSHPKHLYRWEAIKTLEEIGDPVSIPFLIQALEDEKGDVRWIAAKALIKLGKHSIKPLLKILEEKSDSVFILEGAHHVFFDLKEKNELPKDFPADELLAALRKQEWVEGVKPLVYKLLNELKDQ